MPLSHPPALKPRFPCRRYYLISDSLHLRREAAEALGGKLLTSLEVPMQHSRWRGVSKDKVVGAFRTAAAEMWLFALADYHIMSRRSGFGRIGSYMSGRWHQLYAVGYGKDDLGYGVLPPQNRSCSVTDFEVGRASEAENMWWFT